MFQFFKVLGLHVLLLFIIGESSPQFTKPFTDFCERHIRIFFNNLGSHLLDKNHISIGLAFSFSGHSIINLEIIYHYTHPIIRMELIIDITILHSKGFEPLTSSLLSLRSTTEL
jgi:hypothetical protein